MSILAQSGAAAADVPRVFAMDGLAMHRLRQQVPADPRFAPALDELRAAADRALPLGPFSVTTKTKTPPSGDKHDYMSVGPYWWPNPKTPDRLPYASGETAWPHPQIQDMRPASLGEELLPLAIRAWNDPRHREAYAQIEPHLHAHWGRLVFPAFLMPTSGTTPRE